MKNLYFIFLLVHFCFGCKSVGNSNQVKTITHADYDIVLEVANMSFSDSTAFDDWVTSKDGSTKMKAAKVKLEFFSSRINSSSKVKIDLASFGVPESFTVLDGKDFDAYSQNKKIILPSTAFNSLGYAYLSVKATEVDSYLNDSLLDEDFSINKDGYFEFLNRGQRTITFKGEQEFSLTLKVARVLSGNLDLTREDQYGLTESRDIFENSFNFTRDIPGIDRLESIRSVDRMYSLVEKSTISISRKNDFYTELNELTQKSYNLDYKSAEYWGEMSKVINVVRAFAVKHLEEKDSLEVTRYLDTLSEGVAKVTADL